MSSPNELPNKLERVELPQYFNPSTVWKIEECPLSVFGLGESEEDELLPRSPAAYYGTLLHRVREVIAEGLWSGFSTPEEAVPELLRRYTGQLNEKLSAHERTRSLVPIEEVVGRRRRLDGLHRLKKWAARIDGNPAGNPPEEIVFERISSSPPSSLNEPLVDNGTEALILHPDLRICGRPDQLRESSNQYEIAEFKSGRVVDEDGELLPGIRVQGQLYLLALEEVSTKKVSGVIQANREFEVPWGASSRENILKFIKETSESFPAGIQLSAGDLASPGSHCRRCRLRHRCHEYQATAPNWWPNDSDNPRPIPRDVWGTVQAIEHESSELRTVRLRDPNGRLVKVSNIRKERGIDEVSEGDQLWIFDAETSEVSNHHGANRHPKNFHDVSPGPKWSSATTLSLFVD